MNVHKVILTIIDFDELIENVIIKSKVMHTELAEKWKQEQLDFQHRDSETLLSEFITSKENQ